MRRCIERGSIGPWPVVTALALAACGPATQSRDGNDRVTQIFAHGFGGPIIDDAGREIGRVTGSPDKEGLIVAFELRGLKPGPHAIHLHEYGRCDPPDFASSGGHWNPEGRKHGTDNPFGSHEGNWDNLDIGADGRGDSNRLIPRWHCKILESGLSFIIHARRDDERTDPDGRSGARSACAIVIPPD